jgi:hypothetical protein
LLYFIIIWFIFIINIQFLFLFSMILFNFQNIHSFKKYFKNWLHIVDEHFLEIFFFYCSFLNLRKVYFFWKITFILFKCIRNIMIFIWYLTIFIPHFKYDNLIHIIIYAFLFKTLKIYFDKKMKNWQKNLPKMIVVFHFHF